ncbi:MAG: hypothetical protein HZB26_01190, partial [Candidatus Hydrogenedentes bacterium]|nr:hypothetical protein [Candidatus Hydrogenedentota bacterium]
ARYEYRMVNGLAIPQLVQAEHYENVYVPGYYQWNTVRVWVRGSWSCGF